MRPASEIHRILKVELMAADSDYEKLSGPVHGNKQYRYEVYFNDSVTFSHLRKKVGLVEEKEGIPLKIVGIEPSIEVTDDSIESRFAVSIKETEDRTELQNHDLGNFTDES